MRPFPGGCMHPPASRRMRRLEQLVMLERVLGKTRLA